MRHWQRWAARGALAAGAAAAMAAVGLAYAYRYERSQVALDRYTVEVVGLPPAGLSILHLSDFHFRAGDAVQAAKAARLLDLLADEHYDVLALTGDLIHDWSGLPAALGLIRSLRPSHGAFFCPGNHDYAEYSVWGVFGKTWQSDDTPAGRSGGCSRSHSEGSFTVKPAEASIPMRFRRAIGEAYDGARQVAAFARKVARNDLVRLPVAFNDMAALAAQLAACGVESLINRAVSLRCGEADIWFAGVDDLLEGHPDLAATFAAVPEGAPVVLLAHNPDAWLDPHIGRADLVLSGHTHGGQMRLPLMGAIHTQGTHLTRQQPAGWFARAGQQMFVTRGLGESIPLRFGVRPQAALIRLLPGS